MDQSANVLDPYTFGPGMDEPISESRSASTSYYAQDALRSVTSISSTAGVVAGTYNYDSFGNLTASTATLSNPYRHTGRECDTDTGIYFYRARLTRARTSLSQEHCGRGAVISVISVALAVNFRLADEPLQLGYS